MGQDANRTQGEHDATVKHFTSGEMRDGQEARPLAPAAIPAIGTSQATPMAGATSQPTFGRATMGELPATPAEEGLPGWARQALIGLGTAAPIVALVVPGVRRQVVGLWRSGTDAAADAIETGKDQTASTLRAGKRQAADTLDDAKGGVERTWRAGRRQVTQAAEAATDLATSKVDDVRETRQRRQAEARRLQERQLDQQYEQLFTLVKALERQVEARDKRRGGGLRGARPFIFGALVSGGLGLLYAPRTGPATRARLAEVTAGVRERLTGMAQQAQEGAEAVQGQAQGALAGVKDAASSAQGQLQGALNQVKGAADTAREGAQGAPRPASAATSGIRQGAQDQVQAVTARAQAATPPAMPAPATAPFPSPSGAQLAMVSRIREHMIVVAANNETVGHVDHLDVANSIKLTKDAQGQHHWIPLAWVTRVEGQIHLSRSATQARQEWSATAPTLG